MIIKFDIKVNILESQNKWNEVISFLELQWEKDKTDFNNYLCLGTEIWFLIVFYERYKIKGVDKDLLIDKLMDITNFGFDNYQKHKYFNAIFGYMIYLMPYYFNDYNGDYDGWQDKGRAMMKKAYLEEKSNPVFAALFFRSHGEDEKDEEACMLFNQNKDRYFSDSEEVGSYFLRILS